MRLRRLICVSFVVGGFLGGPGMSAASAQTDDRYVRVEDLGGASRHLRTRLLVRCDRRHRGCSSRGVTRPSLNRRQPRFERRQPVAVLLLQGVKIAPELVDLLLDRLRIGLCKNCRRAGTTKKSTDDE